MDYKQNLIVLKDFFSFTIDVLDYCDDLIQIRKKVFADKITKATLSATLCFQVAIDSDAKTKCLPALKKAERELGNAIHWLKLCKKAPSYSEMKRTDLVNTGIKIKDYCTRKMQEHSQ